MTDEEKMARRAERADSRRAKACDLLEALAKGEPADAEPLRRMAEAIRGLPSVADYHPAAKYVEGAIAFAAVWFVHVAKADGGLGPQGPFNHRERTSQAWLDTLRAISFAAGAAAEVEM